MPKFDDRDANALLVNSVAHVMAELLESSAIKATKYLSEKLTVKGTFRGRVTARARTAEILFTVGAPNYAEREFIKQCRKAGEPFPVKKVQLKFAKVVAKRKAA